MKPTKCLNNWPVKHKPEIIQSKWSTFRFLLFFFIKQTFNIIIHCFPGTNTVHCGIPTFAAAVYKATRCDWGTHQTIHGFSGKKDFQQKAFYPKTELCILYFNHVLIYTCIYFMYLSHIFPMRKSRIIIVSVNVNRSYVYCIFSPVPSR